eukprot:SAG11_NODE_15200_length_585_cov_3.761317_1_plen_61_part_00
MGWKIEEIGSRPAVGTGTTKYWLYTNFLLYAVEFAMYHLASGLMKFFFFFFFYDDSSGYW